MAKKLDDDIDFLSSDELFPLDDDMFGGKSQKPPKGVKGYLSNAVKSVGRLGVKLGQTYMPETVGVIESLMPDIDGTNAREMIKNASQIVKTKAAKGLKIGSNVAKELVTDAKDAVMTGNFFKDSDFGDLDAMFGGDDFDVESDFGEDDSEMDQKTASKISSRLTVNAAKASTQATINVGKKQTQAILGVAQSQMKQSNAIFSQQLLIGEQHHNQNMRVMKNIANNIAKLVEQNNISIKAQMEYSLKSLAFSQDVNGLVKDLRDASWKSIGMKEEEFNFDANKTKHSKIFGSSFDKSEFGKHLKGQFDNSMLGQMLGMGSMMSGFGDMIRMEDMIKDQISSGLLSAVSGTMLSGSTKKGMFNVDQLMKNIIPVMNAKMGNINQFGSNIKNPKLRAIVEKIASVAHVEDELVSQTDQYAMGKHDEVHPFDNKAHRTLVEVIPGYLSKIAAGVNNQEQEYYDYKTGRFRANSAVKKDIERAENQVYEYALGYNETKGYLNSKVMDNSNKATGSVKALLTVGNIEKVNDIILRNLVKSGLLVTGQVLEDLRDPDSSNRASLMEGLPYTEEENNYFFNSFIDNLDSMRQDDQQSFINLMNQITGMKSKLNDAILEVERDMGENGSITVYNTLNADKELSRREKNTKATLDRIEKMSGETNVETLSGKLVANKINNLKDKSYKDLRDINRQRDGYSSMFIGENKDDDFSIGSLSNNSSPSMLRNIYELLLDGIVVYPKDQMDDNVSSRHSSRMVNVQESIQRFEAERLAKQQQEKETEEEALEITKRAKENYLNKVDEFTYESSLNKNVSRFGLNKGANNFATNLMGYIEDVIKDKVYDLGPGSGKLTKESLTKNVHGDSTTIKDITDSGKDSIKNTIGEENYNKISENLDKAKTNVKSKIDIGKEKVVDTIGEENIDKIKSRATKVRDDIKNKIDSGKDSINTFFDEEDADKELENISEETISGLEKIKKGHEKTIFNSISNWFKESKISDKIDDIVGKENVDKLKNTLESGKEKIVDTVGEDRIKNVQSKINVTKKRAKIAINKVKKSDVVKHLGELSKIRSANDLIEAIRNNSNVDPELLTKLEEAPTARAKISVIREYAPTIYDQFKNELEQKVSTLKEKGSDFISSNFGEDGKISKFIAGTAAGKAISSIGAHKEGSAADQEADDKEEEKMELERANAEHTAKTATLLERILNKGITLSKDTVDDLEGLGGGDDGFGLDDVIDGGGGALAALGGIAGVSTLAKKGVSRIKARDFKGLAQGVGRVAKRTMSKTRLGSKIMSTGSQLANTSLGKKATSLMKTVLDKFFKNPKIASKVGGKTAGKIIGKILGWVGKNVAKIITKLTAFVGSAAMSFGSITAAMGVTGFLKGLADVRKNFKLGKGVTPSAGMTIASGLTAGLDAMLFGIPSLIALAFGKNSVAEWLYDFIGSDEDKAAMKRYQDFQNLRAKIYGIVNGDALTSFETRTVLDKIGRGVISVLPMFDSNAEKDSKLLGFQHVDIYKYWKSTKYEPLEKIRISVADKYGGVEVVDRMRGAVIGEENQTESPNGDTDAVNEASITTQNQYRKEYLEQARAYVIDNNIAWLQSSTTKEEFDQRMSGKDKEEQKSSISTPDGGLPVAAATGEGTTTTTSQTGQTQATKGVSGDNFNTFRDNSLNALSLELKHGNLTENQKKYVTTISNTITAIFEDKDIQKSVNKELLTKLHASLIKGASKAINKIPVATLQEFESMKPEKTMKMVALQTFIEGKRKVKENFNITDKATPGMIISSGLFNMLDKCLRSIGDYICKNAYSKSLLMVIYEIVGSKEENNVYKNFTEYNQKRAAIIGVSVEQLKKYENKMNVGKNIGKFVLNAITNLFSGGSKNADSKLLGFKSSKVFEFWRDRKYEPLKKLRENIALDFGPITELETIDTDIELDVQKKYFDVVIEQSNAYVLKNNLKWLTNATTEDELDKKKDSMKSGDGESEEKESKISSFFKDIGNFFRSPNTNEDLGNKNYSMSDNIDINNLSKEDQDALMKGVENAGSYSDKTTRVIASGTASIQNMWKSVDPSYGNGTNTSSVTSGYNGNNTETSEEKTGFLGGLFGGDKKPADPGEKGEGGSSQGGQITEAKKQSEISKTPMYMMLNDFKNEVIEKLQFLELLYSETIRHNAVSESFYQAALSSLNNINSNISKSRGNSDFDRLANQLSY